MSLPKGYFGIQRLNGYSHTLADGPIRALVYAIDMFIEHNTGLIAEMQMSPEFHALLSKAVGYDVLVLDTIIGDFPITVKPMPENSLYVKVVPSITPNFEITLTPKGSPDFFQMQQIADEVKNTCEKITCPVIEEAERIAAAREKNPFTTTIYDLDGAEPLHRTKCECGKCAVLKRGAQ